MPEISACSSSITTARAVRSISLPFAVVSSMYSDSGVVFQFTIQETGSNTGVFTITDPVYIPTYVWRAEGENGKYDFHTLAVGRWLNDQPEGMAYADVTRMREVWAEIQAIMGTEVATIAAE